MSEIIQSPGWWMASDGKWYAPELHPSLRVDPVPPKQIVPAVVEQPVMQLPPAAKLGDQGTTAPRWQAQPQPDAHVGPQFPDLFQKALQGSHLADNVSVKYGEGDPRNNLDVSSGSGSGYRTPVAVGGALSVAAGGGSVGEFTGASASKRRWRRGR